MLTHEDATRGGAIQALLLSREQRRAGHDVTVVFHGRRGRPLAPSFGPWLGEGIPLVPFGLGKEGVEHPLEAARFRVYLKRCAPDVVHVHRDAALVFTLRATLGRALPALISQRGTTRAFRTPRVARAHRSRRVHRIVAVAAAVKDALVAQGIDAARIEVVYGSFDAERFDPARADGRRIRDELRLEPGQPLIVQVGEIQKRKGPAHFVRMAQAVLQHRPAARFALVGKGKDTKRIAALCRELRVADRVALLGFRRDVADVYAAADVVVNSSIHREGLTGAVREALAMGRPVAATCTDGNPELVRDGETGVLVDVGDPAAMARAVLGLLADPEGARAMAEQGRRLVHEKMGPQVRAAHVERVYREVLAENGAG